MSLSTRASNTAQNSTLYSFSDSFTFSPPAAWIEEGQETNANSTFATSSEASASITVVFPDE